MMESSKGISETIVALLEEHDGCDTLPKLKASLAKLAQPEVYGKLSPEIQQAIFLNMAMCMTEDLLALPENERDWAVARGWMAATGLDANGVAGKIGEKLPNEVADNLFKG